MPSHTPKERRKKKRAAAQKIVDRQEIFQLAKRKPRKKAKKRGR